ncbi:aspartate-alanine antiporter [Bradyrhizobium lablabi]|uniref:aspartate-alanine antiporter n=1 Tax=Bradyrhizobium lablabi TaxID=722472 RepID=UPI001BA81EE0|nr:aspartate-alanine antiporter [Bradyrhizobium lablabi]MBR0698257.1 aspartate-alanine antiporter [Bradyrhizobium lablabi]
MLAWLEQFLVRYPELALFLVIAAGYWIGSFRIGTFTIGPVTGALFAGLLVGQFARIPVSSMTKSFLFLLFLFGVGYSVGPQFVLALKRNGVKPLLLAICVSLVGLAASVLVARILGLDAGFAAGLLSGGLTQSAAMGTATDAINGLGLPSADRERLIAHMAVADAVCYIFGYAGVILFCTTIAPALLKIDLKAEARKLEHSLGMDSARPDLASAWRKFELRAYRLAEGARLAGMSVAVAETLVPEQRLFIHRIRRGQHIIDAMPNLMLEAGDVVALSGPRQVIVELIGPLAEEREDRELLDIPVTSADVLVINPDLAGSNLNDISKQEWTRGIYVRSIKRGDEQIPVAANVTIERGDMLRIVGPDALVQSAASRIGVVIAPSGTIDFVVLGAAIFLGGLAGVLATFSVGNVKINLSTSVGVLLAGLLVGYLRTRYPLFGRIPDGAVTLMTSLGLAAFVGLTGIQAGPTFFAALRETGLGLFLGGVAVTLLPQFIGLFFGHLVLRMNPIHLLGALAGAQTVTAAMAAVQERSGSPVAVLGYTPAYPVANILLTMWGSIIVLVVAG